MRRERSVERGAKGIIGMGGVPNGVNARKEMGRDRRRGGELEGSKGGRVRNGVRGGRKAIVGPKGSGHDGSNPPNHGRKRNTRGPRVARVFSSNLTCI